MSLLDLDDIGVVTNPPKRKYNKKPVSTSNPMILSDDNGDLIDPDIAFVNRDPIDRHLAKLQGRPDVIFSTLREAGFHAWLENGCYKQAIISTNFNKYKDTKLVDDGLLAVLNSGSGSDKEAIFKYLLVHGTFETTTTADSTASKAKMIKDFLLNKKQLELFVKYKIAKPIGPNML